jgi:hypothetical protein
VEGCKKQQTKQTQGKNSKRGKSATHRGITHDYAIHGCIGNRFVKLLSSNFLLFFHSEGCDYRQTPAIQRLSLAKKFKRA